MRTCDGAASCASKCLCLLRLRLGGFLLHVAAAEGASMTHRRQQEGWATSLPTNGVQAPGPSAAMHDRKLSIRRIQRARAQLCHRRVRRAPAAAVTYGGRQPATPLGSASHSSQFPELLTPAASSIGQQATRPTSWLRQPCAALSSPHRLQRSRNDGSNALPPRSCAAAGSAAGAGPVDDAGWRRPGQHTRAGSRQEGRGGSIHRREYDPVRRRHSSRTAAARVTPTAAAGDSAGGTQRAAAAQPQRSRSAAAATAAAATTTAAATAAAAVCQWVAGWCIAAAHMQDARCSTAQRIQC